VSDLSVVLGTGIDGKPLILKNPVTVASGTFGYGLEYEEYLSLDSLGALTTKAVTLEPRSGNPGQRLIETPSGLINSIGLMNPGVEEFCRVTLPKLHQMKNLPVIVNISGNTVDEYASLAKRLDSEPGLTALEVNISCPNVSEGGMAFGASAHSAAEVTRRVKDHTTLPVFVKLTPNVTDISTIALAVEEAGADGFSLINTLLAMKIDIQSRRPVLDAVFGGLSGPAVKPVAVRMVYQVYKVSKLPIIGMGGISSWEDALEFIMAGASVVAIGTANFANPSAPADVIAGLDRFCESQGVENLRDLIGAAHR